MTPYIHNKREAAKQTLGHDLTSCDEETIIEMQIKLENIIKDIPESCIKILREAGLEKEAEELTIAVNTSRAIIYAHRVGISGLEDAQQQEMEDEEEGYPEQH